MATTILPGEKIIYHAKPHWIYLVGPALVVLVGLSCSCCTALFSVSEPPPDMSPISDDLTYSFIACSTCILFMALVATTLVTLSYINADFILTDRRVIRQAGILNRNYKEIFLSQVESVTVAHPLLGRLLGYGTVVITGSGGAKELLRRVDTPLEIRDRIQHQIARQIKK